MAETPRKPHLHQPMSWLPHFPSVLSGITGGLISFVSWKPLGPQSLQ